MAGRAVAQDNIDAADVLVEMAQEGAGALRDDDATAILRARRHVKTIHRQIQTSIATTAQHSDYAKLFVARKRHARLSKYSDYLNRALRAVRQRVFRAQNSHRCQRPYSVMVR